jgi:hypothetical protein
MLTADCFQLAQPLKPNFLHVANTEVEVAFFALTIYEL